MEEKIVNKEIPDLAVDLSKGLFAIYLADGNYDPIWTAPVYLNCQIDPNWALYCIYCHQGSLTIGIGAYDGENNKFIYDVTKPNSIINLKEVPTMKDRQQKLVNSLLVGLVVPY